MLSTTKLGILGISSLGLIGGAIGINYEISKTQKSTLKELIVSNKRTPLENSATTWDIKYSTYSKSIKASTPLTLEIDNKEGLKKWCGKTLKKEIEISKKDNSDYSIALKLCTKPTNDEKLFHNKKTLVSEENWSKKADSYKSKGIDKNAISIIADKTNATGDQIKKWCNGLLEEELDNNEEKYNLFEKWCSNEVNP